MYDKRFNNFKVGTKEWFELQSKVIQERPLISNIYLKWYSQLFKDADTVKQKGILLELGSGGSFLKKLRPEIISSDLEKGIADKVIDACNLPFDDSSVQAIFLVHVFHHIPDIHKFFYEARRVLVPGGVISIIDVAHTVFARYFYSNFHDEPYDRNQKEWAFKQEDAMIDSNQALSWIVFHRDKELFNRDFYNFQVTNMTNQYWLSYMLSGGVKYKNIIPNFLTYLIRALDIIVYPLNFIMSLHCHITVRNSDKS